MALHFIRGDWGESGGVAFAGPDADHSFDRLDEDLSVAYVSGPCGAQNGIDGGVHERLGTRHLDLDLFVELEDGPRPAADRDEVALTSMATDPCDGDSGDPGSEERLLHSRQSVGADPEAGFTKGQVIDYYIRIAPVLLPHLRNRALTMKRYPEGVNGMFFYEKSCPKYRPEWLETTAVWSEGRGENIDFCMLQDTASLVWAANWLTWNCIPRWPWRRM